jgi:hypothetical protein
MTQFKDFDELFDPLVLPIHGHEYEIPALSFEAGVIVNGVIDKTENLTDEQFYRILLSDAVFDRMLADKLPAAAIDRVARTALTDFKYGRELALTMWETGGDPKAVQEYASRNAPNRASRRSKSTAAARKTR